MMLFYRFCWVLLLVAAAACNQSKKAAPLQAEPPAATANNKLSVLYREELGIEGFNDSRVSTSRFFSGNKSLYLSPTSEFSAGFKIPVSNLLALGVSDSLYIDMMCFATAAIDKMKMVWTIDDGKGNNVAWNGLPLTTNNLNKWEKCTNAFKINPEYLKPDNIFTIYVWNNGKQELWIDDFTLKIMGMLQNQQASTIADGNYFFDMENAAHLLRNEKVKPAMAHSGKMSCDLRDGAEFGIGFKKKFSDFGPTVITKVAASVWIYPTQENHDVVLTFTVVDQQTGESKLWHGKSSVNGKFPLNQWSQLNSALNLPVEKFKLNDEIEIGVWNKGKTGVCVDDLHIVFGDQPGRKSIAELVPENQVFTYHQLENEFIATEALNFYKPGDKLIHALFHKPAKKIESILIIGNDKAALFYCNTAGQKMEVVWQTVNKQHTLLNKDCLFYGGDFDGDGVADLLMINRTNKHWELLHFENENWMSFLSSATYFPENWLNDEAFISVSNQMDKENKSVLVKASKNQIELLTLKNNQWQTSNYTALHQNTSIITHDLLLDWNEGEWLKLNADWRFELNYFTEKDNKMICEAHIAFKGYKNKCNPKYYECTQLLSGNFVSSTRKSLLVLSYNCGGFSPSGNVCSTIENNVEFPNIIQCYH